MNVRNISAYQNTEHYKVSLYEVASFAFPSTKTYKKRRGSSIQSTIRTPLAILNILLWLQNN